MRSAFSRKGLFRERRDGEQGILLTNARPSPVTTTPRLCFCAWSSRLSCASLSPSSVSRPRSALEPVGRGGLGPGVYVGLRRGRGLTELGLGMLHGVTLGYGGASSLWLLTEAQC